MKLEEMEKKMSEQKPKMNYKTFKGQIKMLRKGAENLKIIGPVKLDLGNGEVITETYESMMQFLDGIESDMDVANGKIPLSEYRET